MSSDKQRKLATKTKELKMKHIIGLAVSFFVLCGVANAQGVYQARYGVARTFDFVLYNTDGTLDVDEVDGGAEVTLDCNGTPTNPVTNDFADEGSFYSIAFTAAEMACSPRLTVTIGATDANVFFIDTTPHGAFHHQVIGATGNTTTALHLDGLADQPDDTLNGMSGWFYDDSGGDWYPLDITDWATTGDLATVTELPVTPEASVDYVIIDGRPLETTTEAATAVWASATRTLTSGLGYPKNTAITNYPIWGFDANNDPVTGVSDWDCDLTLEGGAKLDTTDTTETEVDATNFPGMYVVDIQQAATNGKWVVIHCEGTGVEDWPALIEFRD